MGGSSRGSSARGFESGLRGAGGGDSPARSVCIASVSCVEEAEEVHRAGPSEVGQRGAPREGTEPAELGARGGLLFGLLRLPFRLLLSLRVWEKCRRGPFLERQCARVLTRISGEQRRFLGIRYGRRSRKKGGAGTADASGRLGGG